MSSFVNALVAGRFVEVKLILESEPENRNQLFEQKDSRFGGNCLHWAVKHSNIEAIEYLLNFEELDVNAVDNNGWNAFLRAMNPSGRKPIGIFKAEHWLYSPEITKKIVQMLFEANRDFVNSCTPSNANALELAIYMQDLEVIKLLVELGCQVNHISGLGLTVLHRAAFCMRIDVIRYLLFETDCNPLLPDERGWLACRCYFLNLQRHCQAMEVEQIEELTDFGIEFYLATFKQLNESMQVQLLLVECQILRILMYRNHSTVIFRKIVNFIVANSSKKSLVNKIFDANLRHEFTLVSMVLLERIEEKLPGSGLHPDAIVEYMTFLKRLKVWFLNELFALYLIDEATASECVSEISKNGWSFNNCEMMRRLNENVPPETPAQTIFNFGKILLKNGINFLSNDPEGSVFGVMSHKLRSGLIPLSKFEYAPGPPFEVPTLLDLTRMHVRRNTFESNAHYKALEILYSLEIPETLRNVVSFNYQNLKF